MDTPFIYGKLARDNNFTDRLLETNQLIDNFVSGTNTILISPRRWGKSSLVNHAAKQASKAEMKLRFCFIDLFDIRDEEKFYQKLAEEILKVTSSKFEGVIEQSKNFLGNLIPKITFIPDSASNFSISFDLQEIKKNPSTILDLAENIAQKKGFKIIICIDEFQNIGNFSEPLFFQQKLRSHWQKHQKCTYCLYGSKRHMLLDVFTNPSMPFYQFGNILFLEKIKQEMWLPFIMNHFSNTGKVIDEENTKLITELADCHPYYVQQLAQQTWLRTRKTCTRANVQEAFENTVQQLSLLFQTRTDELIETQLNLLKAIIVGETQLSSKQTIDQYRLGSSANVLKSKKMLVNKEIIEIQKDQPIFLDPFYKYWLSKYYFKI
jgi:uncharacterized protein